MNLKKYLKKSDITQAEFGRRLQISRNYISMLGRGIYRPSVHLARAIEAATNGEVTFEELRSLSPKREESIRWVKFSEEKQPPSETIIQVKGPKVRPQKVFCVIQNNIPILYSICFEGDTKCNKIVGATHWKLID